ncbi:hypothetical protein [Paenibacillus gansuensis]|uniref:DUF5590 domain-containing protein n=1 Tax=Paenibacillus gansuensis TaxID=306542 RepID=A0ABW5PKI0_9BACL
MGKKTIWFACTSILLIIVVAYIVISTTHINEQFYLKRAWDEADQSNHILNWQEGEVSVIALHDKRIKQLFIPKPTANANFSRRLLWINGNKVVRVLFHTDNEGLLGPITVYFNPITKQVVGYDVKF